MSLSVIIQIEHVDAVKNLDNILRVEGIDAIIVGPKTWRFHRITWPDKTS